jgi:gliding motility-associated protein GldL
LESKLSAKLDQMLKDAKVDSELMQRLGQSLNKFAEAAKGLDVVVDAAGSTQKFNQEIQTAASKLEGLNQLIENQLHAVDQNAKANLNVAQNAESLKEKMAELNEYMAKLNEVYQGMLSAMGKK